MKISAQEEYGLRCLLQLARAETMGESLTLPQLARLEGISTANAGKLMWIMAKAGLVETTPGSDARTRRVQLTDRARKLVEPMRAEWIATEEALAELEAETPYPLSRAVADLNAALDRKSFYQRLSEHLSATDSNDR